MRLSRKDKKLFIKRYTRETYRKLYRDEIQLCYGFPYSLPRGDGRIFPHTMNKRQIAKWDYIHLEGGYYNQ